jgi:hypothetical protein
VILTAILERIAKKERESDAADRKWETLNLTLAPSTSDDQPKKFMPIPVKELPKVSPDWLESSILLEALVDEEDTLQMELSILFRAVCEVCVH